MKRETQNALGRKKRKIHTEETLEYYLIICEGTKTEPEYFEEVRILINARHDHRVEVRQVPQILIEGEGTNTIFLLDRAQEYISKLKGQVTQVWLVYDKDDFPPDRFDTTSEKADQLSNSGDIKYNVAWSNQCIEYWFLLHFENLQSNLSREQYIEKLNYYFKQKNLGKYRKNRSNIFTLLKTHGDLNLAIRYAKKRLKDNIGKTPSRSTPATRVHELIEDLMKYIPENR